MRLIQVVVILAILIGLTLGINTAYQNRIHGTNFDVPWISEQQ